VRLRLVHRHEPVYFDLFDAAAGNLHEAAVTLQDMLTDLADPEGKARHLTDLEHEGDRITRAIFTRLTSRQVARAYRDDIYTLATRLDDVTDAIEEVADFVLLHRISEPLAEVTEQAGVLVRGAGCTVEGMRSLRQLDREQLDAYWTRVGDLEREGDRLHRRVRAELYNFTADHPAQHVLRWKDITDGIEQALDELAHVAHTVEGITLKLARPGIR
jgi:uncharacterized protein Yka (UPF0111/DUF47 family)